MMRDDIPRACWTCTRSANVRECEYFKKYQKAVYKMNDFIVLYSDVIRVDFQPMCSKKIGFKFKRERVSHE